MNKASQTIPSIIIHQISQFLTQKETIILSWVSQHFRNTIISQGFWSIYEINQYYQDSKFYLLWASVHSQQLQLKGLSLNIMGIIQPFSLVIQRLGLLLKYVQNLGLSVDTKDDETNMKIFEFVLKISTNIKSLTTNLIPESKQFYYLMQNIQELQITNQSFILNQNHILGLPNVKKLLIRPYQINFTAFVRYISLNKNVQQLRLDCQECQPQLFQNLISGINKQTITLVNLEHLECMNSQTLPLLSEFTKLTTLSLLKTFSISSIAWLKLFEQSTFSQLQRLNLTEAIAFEDKALICLLDKSFNLKHVNLSWCSKITNFGIIYLIQKCLSLQQLILIGIKQLNDNSFEDFQKYKQLFNEKYYFSYKNSIQAREGDVDQFKIQNFFNIKVTNPQRLKKLKLLDCQSVNNISDNLLKIIGLFRKNAIIRNYYGNLMGVDDKEHQEF